MPKPNRIIKLLDKILPPDLHHLVGDMEEEFHLTKKEEGAAKARFNFWSQFIRSLPWFFYQSLTWNTTMLFNYLKVSWRNMKRHTGFSAINVFGLAASLAVCLLMILFIMDQKSYDRFHENSHRIVRITTELGPSEGPGEINSYATSPASIAPVLKAQYPEVENAVQMKGGFYGDFRNSGVEVNLEGLYADNNFLSVFDFVLLQGDPKTALQEPNSVILTPESARKLFGKEPALGNVITKVGAKDFTVTGIIDGSHKTHFDFEIIASYETLKADPAWANYFENWSSTIWQSFSYLLLKEGTNFEEFQTKIQEQIALQYSEDGKSRIKHLLVQPLTSINLGPMKYNEVGMVMPGIIAWFLIGFTAIITLIACFNYVSLTIARALNRSKEVGVRKVHGAFRSSVMKQFIIEATMIALFALLFATVILRWLLPEFNSLYFITFTGNQIDTSMLFEPEVLAAFVVFSILVGIVAGFYPSLYLSSFSPVEVLKGISTTRRISGQTLKKIITVGQFTFSIIFITSSLILFQQFQHLAKTDYGFNQESIVNVLLQDVKYEVFRNELVQDPNVQSIASTTLIPATGSMYSVGVIPESNTEEIESQSFGVDENYIQTMGLNLLAGRNFNPEMRTDSISSVIISSELVNRLGFKTPQDAINEFIFIDNKNKRATVIGVVQNFISVDPLSSDDPVVLLYEPEKARFAVIKTRPGKTISLIGGLDNTWDKMESAFSLNYSIMEDQLREGPELILFTDLIKIIGLLAAFSILISCLGLLGLAIYSSENRIKEIGIRKVLGASVNQLVFTLSKEYLWMISIAVILSIPLAWVINSLWLNTISNKADFGIFIYIAGAIIATLLALITITTQTYKAAKSNPITNLRSE